MSPTTTHTIREIAGPVGRLEAILDTPDGAPRALVVVGHPHPQHAGTMHNKVVYRTATSLREIGCAVLRFNFRRVGSSLGEFDEGRGEADDFRAGIDFLTEHYPDIPVWAAGFSFGAWLALTVGARDPRVTLLLGIAPPTHYDLDAFRQSDKPKFLIH